MFKSCKMNKNFNLINEDYEGVIKTSFFSLKFSLESGQFFYFYYNKKEDFYYVINGNQIFKLKQVGNNLYYKCFNSSKEDIISFFNLDYDYSKLIKDICADELLKKAFKKYEGLRILKIDLFQTIISFICSSASNIEKIKKNIKLISKFFGKKVKFDGQFFYLFPNPEDINNIDFLIKAKTGFRAKYILDISTKFSNKNKNFYEDIKDLNYNEAVNYLVKFKGIGEKIADCILLFSLNLYEAFPVDIWIKRILNEYYFSVSSNESIKEIKKKAKKAFKTNLGYKQQFLYMYCINDIKNKINN